MKKITATNSTETFEFIKREGLPFDFDPASGKVTIFTRDSNKDHVDGVQSLQKKGAITDIQDITKD